MFKDDDSDSEEAAARQRAARPGSCSSFFRNVQGSAGSAQGGCPTTQCRSAWAKGPARRKQQEESLSEILTQANTKPKSQAYLAILSKEKLVEGEEGPCSESTSASKSTSGSSARNGTQLAKSCTQLATRPGVGARAARPYIGDDGCNCRSLVLHAEGSPEAQATAEDWRKHGTPLPPLSSLNASLPPFRDETWRLSSNVKSLMLRLTHNDQADAPPKQSNKRTKGRQKGRQRSPRKSNRAGNFEGIQTVSDGESDEETGESSKPGLAGWLQTSVLLDRAPQPRTLVIIGLLVAVAWILGYTTRPAEPLTDRHPTQVHAAVSPAHGKHSTSPTTMPPEPPSSPLVPSPPPRLSSAELRLQMAAAPDEQDQRVPANHNIAPVRQGVHMMLRSPAPPSPRPPPRPHPPRPPPPPPPCPSPEPPSAYRITSTVVTGVNERFNTLTPTAEDGAHLANAGVIIHQFDAMENPSEPWRPADGFLEDRMSGSVLFAGMHRDAGAAMQRGIGNIKLFADVGGFILRPQFTTIFCAFGGDGGTRGKVCHPPGLSPTCVPGCQTRLRDQWCDPYSDVARDGWCNGYPWRPEDLGTMLQRYHNPYAEAVMDSSTWIDNLPWSIEAVFFPSTATPKAEAEAREIHTNFAKAFGLTKREAPLLRLDVTNWHQPFKQVG